MESSETAQNTQNRKADHIRICLEEDVQFRQTANGFDRYRLTHVCLPEIDYRDIDVKTSIFGKSLNAPLLISSMTGGTEKARTINQRLATIAQAYGLAMGVGSQRVAVEKPSAVETFAVREVAPDILLFANIGAVQLNYGYGVAQCQRVVDDIGADALILHLNPLQECIQPGGDRNFAGLLAKIADVCAKLSVPVIAKEVGNGISPIMAEKLIAAGIGAIDVAGAGGTSWALVESARAEHPLQRQLGRTFADWGIPTAECVVGIRQVFPDIPLFASGGLRNGLDIALSIALGANLGGMALPFLQAAEASNEAIAALVELTIAELTTALFCSGKKNLAELSRSKVSRHG